MSYRHILSATSVETKLWAPKDGLSLALQLNISNLEIELDSETMIKFIKNDWTNNKFLVAHVNDCRLPISKFEKASLLHIYHEGNQCANIITELESSFQQQQKKF